MSQQYKLPFTGKQVEEKLENTILTPITASVGQTVKISAVDANGKPTAWEAVDFSEGGTTSTYTNQLPLATDTDRATVYDDNGYIDGYRLSSSGGISAQNGMSATGFIPATPGQTIRIKGATPMQGKNNYIIAYKADNTVSKCASMAYDSTGWITPHDGWMKYENGIIIILLTSTMFGSDFNAVRFCSAQLSDDVIVTVDEKIIDSHVQPNWNQNDPTAPDYVKNRLAWTDDPVETVLLEETELTFVDNGAELPTPIQLTEGQTYVVTYNGNVYNCTAWFWEEGGIVFIGNSGIFGMSIENDKPFTTNGAIMMSEDTSATVKIIEVASEIHKIDEKYLPGTVLTSSTIYPQCLANCFRIDKHPKIYLDPLPSVADDPIISENVTLETWKEFVTMMTDSRYIKFHKTRMCSDIQSTDVGDITTEDYPSGVSFVVNITVNPNNGIKIKGLEIGCVYSETSQTVEFLCYRENTVFFNMDNSTTTYEKHER